jgi:predicted Zn-dependent peptidase
MSNTTLQLSGILYIQAQLEAADVDKVERRVLEEIARLQAEGPTEEERELAITKAESEHAFAYETSDGVASAYGLAQTSATLEDELLYIDRLRAITREQIRDAARKYLPATAYARLAFLPKRAAQ